MKVRSILIVGAVNEAAIENVFSAGFKKADVKIDRYDIYDRYIKAISASVLHKVVNKISPAAFYKSINRDLIHDLGSKRYDAILVFKGMELFPETLKKLKRNTGVLANFNGDHPFVYFFPGSGNENVREGIPFYDAHFSYAKSIVARLTDECGKDAYWIPFGYDSDLAAARLTSDKQFSDNILFVGAYDKERGAYLQNLNHPALHIYGDEKWRTRNISRPYVQKAYQNRSLFGENYRQALHSSMGVINILREQNLIESSHNMRTFEVPGFGGLLISQRTSEQQEFFEEDKEAIFFDTVDELCDKINHLSKNASQVAQIKAAGYQRSVSSDYSYHHRSRQILIYLDQYL